MANHRSHSEILRALDCVYLQKALHYSGLFHHYDAFGPPEYVGEGYECEIEVVLDALHSLSEAVWSYYSEYDETETMYFSHPDMMEYYRLCRVYGKLCGVKLRDNPYMQKAAGTVRGLLYQAGCMTCSYRLQTKINHQWASGVIFKMWPEFDGLSALFIFMVQLTGNIDGLKKKRDEGVNMAELKQQYTDVLLRIDEISADKPEKPDTVRMYLCIPSCA